MNELVLSVVTIVAITAALAALANRNVRLRRMEDELSSVRMELADAYEQCERLSQLAAHFTKLSLQSMNYEEFVLNQIKTLIQQADDANKLTTTEIEKLSRDELSQ